MNAGEIKKSAPPRLVLKRDSGWFAAGWEFGDAMAVLSDAAFKLFAWLCLNADRHTGRAVAGVEEVSRALGRPPSWAEAALGELERGGVCRRDPAGVVEVEDRYWPYEKQASAAGADEYVECVRKMLAGPACVRCRFSPADRKRARGLHGRGVGLPQVQRAVWLGCFRKYATMLNGGMSSPIASLAYFDEVIEEVCRTSTAESYWGYVLRNMGELEREWLRRTGAGRPAAG